MEAITIEQFRPIFEQQKYNHIGLFLDAGGQQRLCPYNSSTMKASERLLEIETKLKGKAQPDGLYFILGKNSVKKDVIPDVYPIKKGKYVPGDSTHIHLTPGMQNGESKMFTYSEALKMEVENTTYKLENKALQDKVSALEKDVDELSNQIDVDAEKAQDLSDKSKSGWQTALADNVVPFLDALIDDRKEERELEARKVNLQAQQLKFRQNQLNALINPDQLLEHTQQNEDLIWEDLDQEQIDGLDVTVKARMHNEFLARFSQRDPEGYEQYLKENNLV